MRYIIIAGLGGGYNCVDPQGVYEYAKYEQAIDSAYEQAVESYHSYSPDDYDEMMEEADGDQEAFETIENENIESWVDYEAKLCPKQDPDNPQTCAECFDDLQGYGVPCEFYDENEKGVNE